MGRAPCCEKVGLRRGRWTADEDEKLASYIRAHGEGSWRSLPKNAGLLRCGKSCRLRWINYLRADLKRGNISQEEEETIVKLHASFGNRWSLIASHLPGRTDNEIKNYWNSHLSRKIHDFHKIDGKGGLAVTDGGKAANKTTQTVGKTKAAAKKKNNNNINNDGSKAKKRKQEKIEDPPASSTQSEEGESMVVDLEPRQTSSTAALCHNEPETGHVVESGLLGTHDEFECDIFGAIEDSAVMSSCDEMRESGSLAMTQTEGAIMGSSEDTEGGALVSSAVEKMGLLKDASSGGGGGGEGVPVTEPSEGSGELVDWDLEGMKAKLWDGQEEDMWSWLWDNECGELDFQGLGGDSGNQVDSMAGWLFSDVL